MTNRVLLPTPLTVVLLVGAVLAETVAVQWGLIAVAAILEAALSYADLGPGE